DAGDSVASRTRIESPDSTRSVAIMASPPGCAEDTMRAEVTTLRARAVTADEIEALATGAWILGTGGGGSPYLGLLNMRALYREGRTVSLVDPAELADDDMVAVVSQMGAPLVGQERLTDPATMAK